MIQCLLDEVLIKNFKEGDEEIINTISKEEYSSFQWWSYKATTFIGNSMLFKDLFRYKTEITKPRSLN